MPPPLNASSTNLQTKTYPSLTKIDIAGLVRLRLSQSQIDALLAVLAQQLKLVGPCSAGTALTRSRVLALRTADADDAAAADGGPGVDGDCILIGTEAAWVVDETGGHWVTVETYRCLDGSTYTVTY
jgi:hypothetical protein